MTAASRSNLLLEYLSTIGSGLPHAIASAVTAIEPSRMERTAFVLNDLMTLGHIDVDRQSGRWAVCRSALAELASPDPPSAVLIGARSRAFVSRLAEATHRVGLRRAALEREPDGDLLERIVIRAEDPSQLSALADIMRILWLPQAARRLAALLPTIGALLDAAPRESIDLLDGLEHLDDNPFQLVGRRWAWRAVEIPDALGVYRIGRPATYWLRKNDSTRRTNDKSLALYGHLRSLLTYDPGRRAVSFHPEARPPTLHLRALVLCAGRLPRLSSGYCLVIDEVPPDVAAAVARSLEQEGIV